MAMLGGMSRIDRDVPPYMLVEGNPSHVRSLNLVAFKRNNFSAEQMSLMKKADLLLAPSVTDANGDKEGISWKTHRIRSTSIYAKRNS